MEITSPPFSITPLALQHAVEIYQHKSIPPQYALRIGIKGAVGCSGINYVIGFDLQKTGDVAFQMEELTVVMEKRQALYLAGVVVDWLDLPDQRGFSFSRGNEALVQ